jgi:phosphoglycerate dehydrogenase-like enzyme
MDVLPTADAVVIAAAATTQTKHFLGARELAALPAHAVVVNVARGSLVDADALVAALRAGKLFGAGLDVMDPEPFPNDDTIWQEHSVVITSHSADTPPMTEPLLAGRGEANVRAFIAGATLFGVVDVDAGY